MGYIQTQFCLFLSKVCLAVFLQVQQNHPITNSGILISVLNPVREMIDLFSVDIAIYKICLF